MSGGGYFSPGQPSHTDPFPVTAWSPDHTQTSVDQTLRDWRDFVVRARNDAALQTAFLAGLRAFCNHILDWVDSLSDEVLWGFLEEHMDFAIGEHGDGKASLNAAIMADRFEVYAGSEEDKEHYEAVLAEQRLGQWTPVQNAAATQWLRLASQRIDAADQTSRLDPSGEHAFLTQWPFLFGVLAVTYWQLSNLPSSNLDKRHFADPAARAALLTGYNLWIDNVTAGEVQSFSAARPPSGDAPEPLDLVQWLPGSPA